MRGPRPGAAAEQASDRPLPLSPVRAGGNCTSAVQEQRLGMKVSSMQRVLAAPSAVGVRGHAHAHAALRGGATAGPARGGQDN